MYTIDKDRYGSLNQKNKKESVDEEEEEGLEGLFSEPEKEGESGTFKPEPEESPIEDEETAKTTASLDTVTDRINKVRAGRSTKDKEIKVELENYYNELSDNERDLLVLYLNSISEILGGDVEGVAAKEPSDPPEQYKITSGEDEADASAATDAAQTAPDNVDVDTPADEEDTSPPKEEEDLPVAVNERKSDWELRIKVRELMER